MAEMIKVNKKVVNDPLYTPVMNYLRNRIAQLEQDGPDTELALAKSRYDGLLTGDVVIESAVTFPDGAVRVCIVSRKTGFARVDIDITRVEMKDILSDFAVPQVEIEDADHLKEYVKSLTDVEPTLFWLKEQQTYGVLITQEQAKTHAGVMAAFGNLFFENYTTERESEHSIDWETLQSGTLTITDPSFGRAVYPLFIYELALSEAQLPEITSNLPAELTSRRGETFAIPNTFWFAGTQDITQVAQVSLSTVSGYASLKRSSDLLELDGETIYGSAEKEIQDEIVVRVTYHWNERDVHKNFRIKLKIEKDPASDLQILFTPTDITAMDGDTVEVSAVAKYKGDLIEILLPPETLKSNRNWGGLTYVRTKPDLTMIYRGKISGAVFPPFQEQVTDLWSGEFEYNDAGKIIKGQGRVNVVVQKPEVIPKFTLTNVPSLLTGYKDGQGTYLPVATYGEKPVPITAFSITTGLMGGKELIELDPVTDKGIHYTFLKDSGVPSQTVRDTFTQTYEWVDPRGVIHTEQFVIQVLVKLDAVVRVLPNSPDPIRVKRYQTGAAPFSFEVNGVVDNSLIRSISIASTGDPRKDYIKTYPSNVNQWWVPIAETDREVTYEATFNFVGYVDGGNKPYTFKQQFIIEKYVSGTSDKYNPKNPIPAFKTPVNDANPNNPGGGPATGEKGTGPGGYSGPTRAVGPGDEGYDPTNPDNPQYLPDPTAPGGDENPDSPGTGEGPYNTEIIVVPVGYTIGGDSDKGYQFNFKVFNGNIDLTSSAEVMNDFTIFPDYVNISGIVYNKTLNVFTVSYSKDQGGVSQGAIFVKLKSNSAPTKQQIARLWLNIDIVQMNVLKVTNAPALTTLDVEAPGNALLKVNFAGKSVALDNPALKIVSQGGVDEHAKIIGVDADGIKLQNNDWVYVGATLRENMPLKLTYTNPDDGLDYTATYNLPIATVYPAMRAVFTGNQEINANIWDTGVFPFVLMAGDKDWTSAIVNTQIIKGADYVISNGKLGWEVRFADKVATTQIVGLSVVYTVGQSAGLTIPVDFKFNLGAWDGVTFITTSHTPDVINDKSGQAGVIEATFTYKGKDCTDKVNLVTGKSTIPNTVILGTPAYDATSKTFKVPYTLTLGGEFPLKLVFAPTAAPSFNDGFTINTVVEWPDEINVINVGKDVRGFWNDVIDLPLEINCKGEPVALDDPSLELNYSSGEGNPIELSVIKQKALSLLLATGGALGTTYNYTITLDLKYTNAEGKVYNKSLSIPASIRVSAVKVATNPVITADVYAVGKVKTTLSDERARPVAITRMEVTGAGINVSFTSPDSWYITTGSTAGPVEGELPLRLWYEQGGDEYSIDVVEKFTINKWDGIFFKGKSSVTDINGAGGDTDVIPVTFDYKGFPTKTVKLDRTRSVIPDVISITDLDADGNITYTLAGNDEGTLKLCFLYGDPGSSPVEGRDMVFISIKVKVKSSNLPFELVSNDDAVTLDWNKEAVIKLKVTYGGKVVPNNAPGLVFSLGQADVHGLTIVGQTVDGVRVKASRSTVPGSTTVYPENLIVKYEVGAPEPKTVNFDVRASVTMGPATIGNNLPASVSIWQKRGLVQTVMVNGVPLSSIDRYEVVGSSDYIEMYDARNYEVIAADAVNSTHVVPMAVFYRIDSTTELQRLDFDATFNIAASTSVRFKATGSPAKVEGGLDVESKVTVVPVYKDKNVGQLATFKPGLSTIPPQLTLKEYRVVGTTYEITFVGAKAGLAKMDLVFWSPDAGTSPLPRDVAKASFDVKVMGELGIEIGNRDNLITGKDGDTGTYGLEVLFGGIPIDIAAEMSKNTLTMTVEVGAASSMNANVLSAKKWAADSFDYGLSGVVAPGQAVNVSDFINIVYTYGGTQYRARVEIPLKYTTAPLQVTTGLTAPVKMFAVGTLTPKVMCGTVDISSTLVRIQNTDEDAYITWTSGKAYQVIKADVAQTVHAVPSRLVGQYRNWPYSANADIEFTIAAWNQKTWDVTTSVTSLTGYEGGTRKLFGLTATYQGEAYAVGSSSLLDLSRSDLGGLVDVSLYNQPTSTNQNYAVDMNLPGKYKLKLCWVRRGAPTPGVENVDFVYTYLDVDIANEELVIELGTGGNAGITAGNGDNISNAALQVKRKSNGAVIPNNSAALAIAVDPTDLFKINSLAAGSMDITMTIDPTKAPGAYTTLLTAEWTNPTSGRKTTGTFNYPITVRRPNDYPIFTLTGPYYTPGGYKYPRLWEFGGNPYLVKSNGVDISNQCEMISMTGGLKSSTKPEEGTEEIAESRDFPIPGTWWQQTQAFNARDAYIVAITTKMRVPYRGKMMDVELTDSWYPGVETNAFNRLKFRASTTMKSVSTEVGAETEIPVKLEYRGYKYADGVFKPGESITPAVSLPSEYFDLVSTRYDDTTGLTYLTVKSKKVLDGGTVAFVFDKKDAGSSPVFGEDRTSVSVTTYAATVTDLKNSARKVWDALKTLSTIMTVKVGTTDITAQCKVIAISNSHLVNKDTATTANPRIGCESDDAFPAFTGDVEYTLQLPAAYDNRTIKALIATTIEAYDGVEFYAELWGTPTWPYVSAPGRYNPLFMFAYYRGQRISQTDMGTKVASNVTDLRAANVGVDPNNLLTYGGFSYVTPANIPYIMIGYGDATKQYRGDIDVPLYYTGPGSDKYPSKTLNKNYTVFKFKSAVFYENKLYPLPSNYVAPQVEGKFGDTLAGAITSSIGKDVPENAYPMYNQGMSWAFASSMAGLLSKPSNDFSTATGINFKVDYDNRGADVVIEAPVTVTANITNYRGFGVTGNYTYIQKVLIKGTNTGNTVTTTPRAFNNVRVWDIGGNAVTIVHNGKTIASTAIKDIKIAANSYVRRPEDTPDFSNRWFEVYDGPKDGVTTTVTFTITYTDGIRDFTVTQDVVLTILPYAGSPFRVTPVMPVAAGSSYVENGLASQTSATGTGYLQVLYKNQTMTGSNNGATMGMDATAGAFTLPGFSSAMQSSGWGSIASGQPNAGVVYTFSIRANADAMDVKQTGRIKFGFKDKLSDPNSVEGRDWIYVDVPCFVYNYYRPYIAESDIKPFTGKYGDAVATKIVMKTHIRNTWIPLTSASISVTCPDNANLAMVTGLADQATTLSLYYKAELTTAKQLTADFTVTTNAASTDPLTRSTISSKATQISNLPFPNPVDIQTVTATLNDTGGLPFRLVDENGADLTSQATMTGIVANDYIEFVNGKWRCKDARTGDTQIKVTFKYSITYQGKLLTPSQDITFIIKPYTAQPVVSDVQIVNGKVWDKGTVLPFTIKIGGNPVPQEWITAVSGTSVNGRVTPGPTAANTWKIVAGDTTKAVGDTATFNVTVTTPSKTFTVTQDVIFNIAKYDGVEFKINVMDSASGSKRLQAGFIQYNTTSATPIFLEGYYRGDRVTAPQNVAVSMTGSANDITPTNQTGQVQYMVTPRNGANQETRFLTVTIKRDASAGTTDKVDVATVTIPVYLFNGTGQRFLDPRSTVVVDGKYAVKPVMDLHMFVWNNDGSTVSYTDLVAQNATLAFSPTGIVEMVPGSLTPYGYQLRFVTNKYVEQTDTVAVTVTIPAGTLTYNLTVTQRASDADKPDVTDVSTQNAGVNQTGGVPFKLVDPDTQENVTSAATITSLSTNDYLELVNGKWRVKKDVQAETSTVVTFTLSLTYRGKAVVVTQDVTYLIKPFAGNFGIVNQKDITANVWDRGTELPFTLTINGNTFPAEWITGYSALPSNDKVTIGTNGLWQIVAGDLTQAITTTVGYGVRVTAPGGVERVAVPTVKFNINKYDGIEFKIAITNLSVTGDINQVARKDGFNTTPPTPSNASVLLQGTYRGDVITASPGFTVKDLVSLKNMSALSLSSGASGVKSWTAALTSTTLVKALNLVRFVRTGATGTVEGVDVFTLTIPITTYLQDTLQAGILPNPLVGKFGELTTVTADVRYNGVKRKLNDPSFKITYSIGGSSNMALVANSATENDFKVQFKADVATDTNGNTTFNFSTTEYPSTVKSCSVVAPYTQKPSVAVELKDVVSPLTMNLWETKALSFKVMLNGTTDITSSVTAIEATNAATIGDKFEFVKLSDTSWGYKSIKSSASAQTTATGTFNVKVTYNGKDYVLAGSVNLVTNINNGSIPANRFNVEMM